MRKNLWEISAFYPPKCIADVNNNNDGFVYPQILPQIISGYVRSPSDSTANVRIITRSKIVVDCCWITLFSFVASDDVIMIYLHANIANI